MMKRLLYLVIAGLAMTSLGTAYADQARIDICHEGHTITVATPALADHVGHGDELCSCEAIDDCAAQGGTLDDGCGCTASQSQPCEPAGVCGDYTECGSGAAYCLCAMLTDGAGSCLDADAAPGNPCPNGDVDCPAGELCVVESCFEEPTCVPVCPAP